MNSDGRGEWRARAGMADQHHFILKRRLEQEIATLGQGIEPLVLGLEFQRAKPVCLATAAHFLAKHVFRNKRIEASRPCETVWMTPQRSADFLVLPAVILDDRKRNQERPVNPGPRPLNGASLQEWRCGPSGGRGQDGAWGVENSKAVPQRFGRLSVRCCRAISGAGPESPLSDRASRS